MNYQIIILAAGKGTRMGREDLPKVLILLAGKPMILHLTQNIKQLDLVNQPIVVVGFRYELVQAALGSDYIYAFQQGQLGTGHAVASAQKTATGKNLLVLYGDMPFIKATSLNQLIEAHQNNPASITMFTAVVPNFDNEFASHKGFGRIIRDARNQIVQIKEFVDCSEEERQITEVNPGIYLFSADWLWSNIENLKPHNKQGELYLTDMIEVAVNQGIKISDIKIDPREVFGINTPNELAQAETILKNQI